MLTAKEAKEITESTNIYSEGLKYIQDKILEAAEQGGCFTYVIIASDVTVCLLKEMGYYLEYDDRSGKYKISW